MAISPIAAYKVALPSAMENITSLGSEQSGGKSFGDFLKETVSAKVSSLRNFDRASTGSLNGSVTDMDLITSINEADLQLQTLKIVLEKTVQGFKDLVEKTSI